jgi:hypothetical protein
MTVISKVGESRTAPKRTQTWFGTPIFFTKADFEVLVKFGWKWSFAEL